MNFMRIIRLTALWGIYLSLAACTTLQSSIKKVAEVNADYERARQMAYGGAADKSIVSGTDVGNEESEAKSAILLLITRGSALHVCTSVLVAPKVLLTAAHCVAGVEPSKIRIAFQTRGMGASEAIKDLRPIRIVLHEKYDGTPESKADLALLSLPEKPPRGYTQIPLLSKTEKVAKDDVLLIGYGITGETKSDSMTLRKTTKSWSKEIHLKDGYFGITQSSATGGFCRGDSGAPVLVTIAGGERRLLGLNSFTIGVEKNRECHTASVAMFIPHFKSWIESRVTKL